MSLFHGMLLFDIAENPINGWEEDLGYRGMKEVWRKGSRHITIEPYDGEPYYEDEWECWLGNDETGAWGSIAFGSFDRCKEDAVAYMRAN